MEQTQLPTHGGVALRGGRSYLEADWSCGDGGPGRLSLTAHDEQRAHPVRAELRLDPFSATDYILVDWTAAGLLVLGGGNAVVCLRADTLAVTSSVTFMVEEAELVGEPRLFPFAAHEIILFATQQRVWCLSPAGTIRWMWAPHVPESPRSIVLQNPIELRGGRVRLVAGAGLRESVVELSLESGLEC